MASLRILSSLALLAALPIVASAQLTITGQFNLPSPGDVTGVGYDPSTDSVYVHTAFAGIRQFSTTGTLLNSFASPTSTNDLDLDFAPNAFNLGGTTIPAGSLLFTGGEGAPTIYALNAATGAIIASVVTATPGGSIVGSAYSASRGTQFLVSYSADDIYEVDPATGATLNTFDVRPAGSPAFDVFFGDLEVGPNGNLFLVSDSQNVIRELTPTGGFVQDYNLTSLGISGLAGIAFDDDSGIAYLGSRANSGRIYQVSGFQAVPEPATMAALGLGAAALLRRRKRA